MLEQEIEEPYDYWNDTAFIAELDKRSSDYKNGKVKGVQWEEAKAQILTTAKQKKK